MPEKNNDVSSKCLSKQLDKRDRVLNKKSNQMNQYRKPKGPK